jgi:hypothetical protein
MLTPKKHMLTQQFRLILLCLLVTLLGGGGFFATTNTAVAQTIIPTPPQNTTTDAPDTGNNPTSISFTLADLGYDDLRLRGLYGNGALWVPFQSDWPVTGDIQFDLHYTGSPLLHPDEAILTVLGQDLEVTSFRPVGDGQEQRVSITIPASQRLPEGVGLAFQGYLRLTDNFCEDSFNTGQWLIVRNSSRITLNLLPNAPAPELPDLPTAVAVQGTSDPAPILFVLPEETDDLSLTTAARVATRLGSHISPAHLPLQVAHDTNLTEQQRAESNIVLVGLPEDVPLIQELSDQFPVPPTSEGFVAQDGKLIPTTDGVIQIFTSPWNPRRNILLVSGNGAEGLEMAGRAFTHQPTFASLKGAFHFVHGLVPQQMNSLPRPWSTPITTFAQFGEDTRTIMGLGLTDSYYYFPQPAGMLIDTAQSARLNLHLVFSPALRDQTSYATVYLNDIYVGHVDASATDGDTWIAFDLPAQALNNIVRQGRGGEFKLQLSIANLLPTDSCEQVNAESSWTKIYADSFFELELDPMPMPDLQAFPYPFGATSDERTRFLLPQEPLNTEKALALSLAARMGQQPRGEFSLEVQQVQPEATTRDHAGYNLVLLGTTNRHPLLQQLRNDLQTTAPALVYQVLGVPQVGFYQMATYEEQMGQKILAIFGPSWQGFNTAAQQFYDTGNLVRESGSLAVVRPEQGAVVIYQEAGQPSPFVTRPDVINETLAEATPEPEATTAVEEATSPTPIEDAPQELVELSNTEWFILIATAFLIILVSIAALIRIAWRIKA